jgi:hypothetical protein
VWEGRGVKDRGGCAHRIAVRHVEFDHDAALGFGHH